MSKQLHYNDKLFLYNIIFFPGEDNKQGQLVCCLSLQAVENNIDRNTGCYSRHLNYASVSTTYRNTGDFLFHLNTIAKHNDVISFR